MRCGQIQFVHRISEIPSEVSHREHGTALMKISAQAIHDGLEVGKFSLPLKTRYVTLNLSFINTWLQSSR
jgi:hypothetical protein